MIDLGALLAGAYLASHLGSGQESRARLRLAWRAQVDRSRDEYMALRNKTRASESDQPASRSPLLLRCETHTAIAAAAE